MPENSLQSIDFILNKWAIVIQVSILLVMVFVFIALWKNFARKVVLAWMLAWIFNLTGLVAIFIVLISSEYLSEPVFRSIYLIYALCKIWFAILLAHGLSRYTLDNVLLANKTKLLVISSLSIALILFVLNINTLHIQIIVYTIIGIIFATAGLYHLVFNNKRKQYILQLMFCIEGCVFLHHAWVLYPTLFGQAVPAYMSHISFLDSISELFLGIACLFAIVYRVIEEHQHSNHEMESAQQSLRLLVDNDPLTGLWNRRKLVDFIDEINNQGTLIYIDVDKFKSINDTWGHTIGDACLQRISLKLRQVLSHKTGLFRLGGDEFLAIIPQDDDTNISLAINQLKKLLAQRTSTTPAISVSIGIHELNKNTDFNQALKMADEKMYHSKKSN